MDPRDALTRAELEPSTQPDKLQFREVSSFSPSLRLGTVPGDREVLDSRSVWLIQVCRLQAEEVEGRIPGSGSHFTCVPFSPGDNSYRKERILHRPGMLV